MPHIQDAPPGSMLISSSVKLDAAGATDVGSVRETNQDQFLIASLQRTLVLRDTSVTLARQWLPESTEGTVMIVADGMGGTEGGDIASTVAVSSIVEYLCAVMPWARSRLHDIQDEPSMTLPGVKSGLHKALVEGDSEVKRAALETGGSDMGTTVTMAYLLWPQLYVAHVGDSRCYLLRGGELQLVTTDHTLAERLRTSSNVVVDDASPWHHVLWNALGGGEHAALEPEVHRHHLQEGDIVLLCSDGLTKHCSDEEIATTLQSCASARAACDKLVAMAIADGGSDNITVIVGRCKSALPERLPVDSADAATLVRKKSRDRTLVLDDDDN